MTFICHFKSPGDNPRYRPTICPIARFSKEAGKTEMEYMIKGITMPASALQYRHGSHNVRFPSCSASWIDMSNGWNEKICIQQCRLHALCPSWCTIQHL